MQRLLKSGNRNSMFSVSRGKNDLKRDSGVGTEYPLFTNVFLDFNTWIMLVEHVLSLGWHICNVKDIHCSLGCKKYKHCFQ